MTEVHILAMRAPNRGSFAIVGANLMMAYEARDKFVLQLIATTFAIAPIRFFELNLVTHVTHVQMLAMQVAPNLGLFTVAGSDATMTYATHEKIVLREIATTFALAPCWRAGTFPVCWLRMRWRWLLWLQLLLQHCF